MLWAWKLLLRACREQTTPKHVHSCLEICVSLFCALYWLYRINHWSMLYNFTVEVLLKGRHRFTHLQNFEMLLAICEKKLAILASTGNYFRPWERPSTVTWNAKKTSRRSLRALSRIQLERVYSTPPHPPAGGMGSLSGLGSPALRVSLLSLPPPPHPRSITA